MKQKRAYQYRRPGQREALWSTLEWLVGACGDVVLAATVPHATTFLTARDLTTGQARWSLSGREQIVAAISPEWVLLVDPPPTMDEVDAVWPERVLSVDPPPTLDEAEGAAPGTPARPAGSPQPPVLALDLTESAARKPRAFMPGRKRRPRGSC